MKIGIVEWRIGCGGGRHSTMMAFADCLHESGHAVSVFSQLDMPARDIIHFYGCHLPASCLHDTPLQRRYYHAGEIPEAWHEQDLIIVSSGGWCHIQQHLSVNVVAWIIHPEQARDAACTRHWTNSKITAGRLLLSERWSDAAIEVVIPPHDYSAFQRESKPLNERQYDVAIIGAAIPSKELEEAATVAVQAGRRTGAAVKVYNEQMAVDIYDQDHQKQMAIVNRLALLGVDVTKNAPREGVAKLLGNSRFYLSLSTNESCSLVIYEALNAGCTPIVLDVGSAVEQLGGCGYAVKGISEVSRLLKGEPKPMEEVLQRGRCFDRGTVRERLLAAVERAAA